MVKTVVFHGLVPHRQFPGQLAGSALSVFLRNISTGYWIPAKPGGDRFTRIELNSRTDAVSGDENAARSQARPGQGPCGLDNIRLSVLAFLHQKLPPEHNTCFICSGSRSVASQIKTMCRSPRKSSFTHAGVTIARGQVQGPSTARYHSSFTET